MANQPEVDRLTAKVAALKAEIAAATKPVAEAKRAELATAEKDLAAAKH